MWRRIANERGRCPITRGLAAEEAVAQLYDRSGRDIAAQRWRGTAGEIDLIARDGAEVIFIEVKQSSTHAQAAEHLTPRQMARIYAAASEFLAGEPAGQADRRAALMWRWSMAGADRSAGKRLRRLIAHCTCRRLRHQGASKPERRAWRLKVALQMDPIGSVNINADSTFRIALEAQARGHSLFFYTPGQAGLCRRPGDGAGLSDRAAARAWAIM